MTYKYYFSALPFSWWRATASHVAHVRRWEKYIRYRLRTNCMFFALDLLQALITSTPWVGPIDSTLA